MFVRNRNTTKHQYNQFTLLGFSDCLMGSNGNPAINLGNLDFFSELTATPTDWPRWLARKQELPDELIADKDYDPLDPSQRRLESRLRKSLLKDYINYNDYDFLTQFQSVSHQTTMMGTTTTAYQKACVGQVLSTNKTSPYKTLWIWAWGPIISLMEGDVRFFLWAGCTYLPAIHEEKSFTRNYW